MKQITLFFIGIACLCLIFADLEVISLDPWFEIGRIFQGFLKPDFKVLFELRTSLVNTVIFAFCGSSLAFIGGIVGAFFYKVTIVRYLCSSVRSIHEIFWSFLFLPLVGLNPTCGILAIAVHNTGIFAKGLAEIYQEADRKPYDALPKKIGKTSAFFYAIIPVIYPEIKHFTRYRFECALRSSAVLGFIGLPTIGFHLETFFREGMYTEASALLIAFYLLIASLKFWLREKMVPLYLVCAWGIVSTKFTFSMENIIRFFTYEIIPWPMRKQGFVDGTNSLTFEIGNTIAWLKDILFLEAMPGIFNTMVLTQISFVLAGLATMVLMVTVTKHFAPGLKGKPGTLLLIVLRTTPEYILAYICIQIFGPSMIPAILALSLHNGAIVAFLTVKSIDQIPLPMDRSKGIINCYFYEVIPRIYGVFLANLFYRWEVMVRESALFGILGIYTLGFYVDSAISDDKMDKVIIIIAVMALLNIGIDSLSQRVRRKIKSEGTIVAKAA